MGSSCAQFTDLFVSRDERLIAVLGNNTAQTFFATGFLGNGFAILSDRRVYFRGSCLLRTGKRFSTIKEERVVDVGSVTETGFIHCNPIWRLVITVLFAFSALLLIGYSLILSLILFALSAVVFLSHRAAKRTVFEISHAGGGIGLDLRWITPQEADFFQKSLHLTRDVLEREHSTSVVRKSGASDLSELASLLAKGLITREEFDTQKARLL